MTFRAMLISLSMFISSLHAHQTCSDAYECRNGQVDDSSIECDGYYGCRGASLSTQSHQPNNDEENIFVDCSAMLSCHDSHGIRTDGNLHCSAYKTCYRTNDDYEMSIGGFMQCSGASACEHTEREASITVAQSVFCGGLDACYNVQQLSTSQSTHCLGEHACAESSVIANQHINCNADNACATATLQADETVLCGGSESCAGATIVADRVDLFGENSGMDSTIDAVTVRVFGASAAKKSTIRPKDVNTPLRVEMIGHSSGNAATVICDADTECLVQCRNSACINLQYQCHLDAKCDVEPAECMSNPGGVTKEGIDCPIISHTLSESSVSKHQSHHQPMNRRRLRKDEDESTVECTSSRQCEAAEYTDVAVKCGGAESCSDAVIHAGETGKHISCYGAQSCFAADLETRAGSIYCDGYQSCQTGNIRGQHMQCLGEESCADIACATNPCEGAGRITSIEDMQCDGTNACKASKIKTMASIQCSANRACYQSRVDARFDTKCSGYQGCYSSNIVTNHELSCHGVSSCFDSKLSVTKKVQIGAHLGAAQAMISANEIVAMGYLSAAFATFDSADHAEIDAHFFGHYAGYYSTLICRTGSVCNLVCKSTGCKQLSYVCMDGAECNVLPAQCLQDDTQWIHDIDCPKLLNNVQDNDDIHEYAIDQLRTASEDPMWVDVLEDVKVVDNEYNLMRGIPAEIQEDMVHNHAIWSSSLVDSHSVIVGFVVAVISMTLIVCYYMQCSSKAQYHILE